MLHFFTALLNFVDAFKYASETIKYERSCYTYTPIFNVFLFHGP